MGYYYVYQHKEEGLPAEKHLNVSEEYPDRDLAKKKKYSHMSNDPGCVFSEIIKASSEDEALQQVKKEWLNRL